MADSKKANSTKSEGDTTKKQSTATTPSVGSKALPVITEDEVGRIIDLGLGRGVDATNPSLWQNKSSFQVRRVTIDNIIGTEEGGSLQSYERELSSVTSQQTNLKASVAIPQAPVNLGVEGEQSRSVSTSRKAIGKRVVNRTISFASQFDDLPLSSSKTIDTNDAKKETSIPRLVYPTEAEKKETAESQEHIYTFEERLSKWIIERVLHRHELSEQLGSSENITPSAIKVIGGIDPLLDVSNYLHTIDKDGAKQIVQDCADFVYHFRITHYVSSISLGAAQYRVLSETEYFNKVSAKGTFGFEAIANLVVSESFSKKTTNKASDLREIGKIVGERVKRGTYDEAVIGVNIQPIHQLVRLRFIHLALRKALLDYIESQGTKSSGPYLIGCGDENIYWKVNEQNGYSVEGTRISSQASLFYIITTDEGDHPYEFLIGWKGDEHRQIKRVASSLSASASFQTIRPLRYLDAYVNVLGRNSGPLQLKHNMTESHGRLSLHSRLVRRHDGPVDLRDWILGKELFFINCSRRRAKIDGFISTKRIRQTPGTGPNQPEFTSVCVSSVKHNNENNHFMLFRLESPLAKTEGRPTKHSDEFFLDEEFDDLVGNRVRPSPKAISERHVTVQQGSHSRQTGASGGLGLEMKEIAPISSVNL